VLLLAIDQLELFFGKPGGTVVILPAILMTLWRARVYFLHGN